MRRAEMRAFEKRLDASTKFKGIKGIKDRKGGEQGGKRQAGKHV